MSNQKGTKAVPVLYVLEKVTLFGERFDQYVSDIDVAPDDVVDVSFDEASKALVGCENLMINTAESLRAKGHAVILTPLCMT
jgi:hypothetical protein